MAITTDITYEVKYNGTTVDEIGQSKTLNLLTSAEIEDFLYCGCYNNTMSGNLYPYSTTEGSYDTWNSNGDKYMPFKTDAVTGTYMEMLIGGGSYNDTAENGRYVGVVLVVDTTGEGYVNTITQTNASKYRIVTELDARNYYIDHTGNFTQVDGYGATDWEDENAGLYNYDYTGEVLHYIYDDNGTERDINLYGEINIFPYAVFVDSNTDLLYLVKLSTTILQLSFKAHIATNYNAGYCLLNFTGNNDAVNSLSVTYNCLNFGTSFTDAGDATYNWLYPSTHDVYKYHNTDKDFVGRTHFQYHDFETAYWFTKLEQLLWLFAAGGLKFQCDGTMYKPLISDNVVYGYTDDMDKESELDNYTGSTKHDIPVTPPTPPAPSGDDMDSQALGATGSSGGFTKFFVMSPQDLSDFLTDFYNRADSGETLSNNLVCSYILGVPSSAWSATESIPITINNSAQGTPFVSSANYSHVTATNNYLTIGTFNVPRKTGTFYDFAPYSTYELFIPCCGWITLPDTVAGRTISVSLQIDIATCGAKGIVKFDDGSTCAVCSGVLGSSIPMQIIESGLLRGANVQAASSALGGALLSGAGFGGGNVGLGLGGISQVVSGFTQSAIAGNTNYTNQKGSSGDITQFAMGHNCYIKITYPPIDDVVNNTMFGHTVGYLCEEVDTLSNFHGFTVCANPHIHISATSAEKEEIKRLLEEGVILPSA